MKENKKCPECGHSVIHYNLGHPCTKEGCECTPPPSNWPKKEQEVFAAKEPAMRSAMSDGWGRMEYRRGFQDGKREAESDLLRAREERDESRLVARLQIRDICAMLDLPVSEAPLSDMRVRIDYYKREAKGRIHAELQIRSLSEREEGWQAWRAQVWQAGSDWNYELLKSLLESGPAHLESRMGEGGK